MGIHVNEKRYGTRITAGPQAGGNPIVYHITGLRFETYMKWLWYFEYRAALYKVANPRHTVTLEPHQYEYIPTEMVIAKKNKDAIAGKKAQVTKWKKLIDNAKKEWDELFPIEDDPYYIMACEKLQRLETELMLLINSNKK
jgi:hypothetical protein